MDIAALALEYGAANLAFFIPMSPLVHSNIIPGIAFRRDSDPTDRVECRVMETRYKVLDHYKITLAPVNPHYGLEHFYISDLEAMIQRSPDDYQVYVINIDGYQRVS